jgi:hypothetical protein
MNSMTFRKFIGTACLALAAAVHAEPVEVSARGGHFKLCDITTEGDETFLRGSMQMLEATPEGQWSAMIAIGLRDGNGEPIYRAALLGGSDPDRLDLVQTFLFGRSNSATEHLQTLRTGEAVKLSLAWDKDALVSLNAGSAGRRDTRLQRKPVHAMAVVSGATARLDFGHSVTLDCSDDVMKRDDASYRRKLMGTWAGLDEAGKLLSVRLLEDGHAFLELKGQTIGGGDDVSGRSLRYELDTNAWPMGLDFVVRDAAGQELARFKMAAETADDGSLLLTVQDKTPGPPGAQDPTSVSRPLRLTKLFSG